MPRKLSDVQDYSIVGLFQPNESPLAKRGASGYIRVKTAISTEVSFEPNSASTNRRRRRALYADIGAIDRSNTSGVSQQNRALSGAVSGRTSH